MTNKEQSNNSGIYELKLSQDISVIVTREAIFDNLDNLEKTLEAYSEYLSEEQIKFLHDLYKNG